MFCDKCPHQEKINAAMIPCQSCTHRSDCKECGRLAKIKAAMRACENCDAGRLSHTYHFDGAKGGLAEVVAKVGAPVNGSGHQTTGCTMLEPDVEDALRKALFVIFDFTPIELLLIQHVIHGRNLSTFREPLAQMKDRLNSRYDLSEGSKTFRAIAHVWKNNIVKKFPPIAEMFDAVSDDLAGSKPPKYTKVAALHDSSAGEAMTDG